MDTLSFEQLKKFIDTNNAEYYNVYNSDQDVITYFSADYYINNKQDNADIDQKLNIAFTDIEVYQQDRTVKFNFDGDEYPINAITTYITHLKTFFVSYILIPTNAHLFDSNYDFLGELKRQKYCDDDCKLQLTIYTDEKVMLIDHWNLIKSNNVAVLSGFNLDTFDLPYIYRRMIKLFTNKYEVNNMISSFGYVELGYNKMLKIPDYVILDTLYLYKPRSDGGLVISPR